jgi:hypothetical protein
LRNSPVFAVVLMKILLEKEHVVLTSCREHVINKNHRHDELITANT